MNLEARRHWKELSMPRHEGCSLSNHLLIKNVFSIPYLLFHMYVLLDSLVTSIDLVDYIVCYHVSLVVFSYFIGSSSRIARKTFERSIMEFHSID